MWAIHPYFPSYSKQFTPIPTLEKRGLKFGNSPKLKKVSLDREHIEQDFPSLANNELYIGVRKLDLIIFLKEKK